ncbi:membrane dipeptidase-domain-containing protein [Amanita rubescens]|nr:membrane dipeptidase-domain-containing protein [Amanita rubescens]
MCWKPELPGRADFINVIRGNLSRFLPTKCYPKPPLIRPPVASNHQHDSDDEENSRATPILDKPTSRTRAFVGSALILLFAAALVLILCFEQSLPDTVRPWLGLLPKDPMTAALAILKVAPVIVNLPILVREIYANNISAVDLESRMPGQVDIPRLRQGAVGGLFWYFLPTCEAWYPQGNDELDFTVPSWRVRDTLEQIDVARSLIYKYPDTFQFALTADTIEAAVVDGKIASILGVEGGHQLGNSISVLRQYYNLGVRYVTLTHTCHNAFADSSGPSVTLHNGLSSFGLRLIDEMNRLGILVDLSHTSDATAVQALNYSKAPVIWSHSSARAIHDVPRNVPDYILQLLGTGPGKKDGIVMVNFVPEYIAVPGNASVDAVVDHIEHIARITGKGHVGLGSDFDGILNVPVGLEDVSCYPALIAKLYERGWNKYELAGLTGANILRVLQTAEDVAKELQDAHTEPIYDLYDERTDLPSLSLEL